MSFVCLVISLVLFILAGLGVAIHGLALEAWGLAFLVAGIIFGGVPLPWHRGP